MCETKKLFVAIFTCLVCFSGCSKKSADKVINPETEEKDSTPVTITLGFSTNMQDPRAVASLLFKDEVEKNSEGRILVSIHPDGELGGDGELIEGVINGNVDMTVSSAGNFAVYATKCGISAMPFLFSSFEEAWKFMDSSVEKEVDETLKEFGIVVLSHFDNGFRCVTTTNRPVKKISDMKGLKIRTPPNQIVMETMSVLGATPKPYAFNELKKALEDGLFDSQENPIPVIYNSKLYEQQKYLSVTNHSYDSMPLVIRKALWDKFSEEDKALIVDAAVKAQNLNRKLVKEQTEAYVSKLKEAGMIIINVDIGEFQKATAAVIDVFSNVYGEKLIDELKNMQGKN